MHLCGELKAKTEISINSEISQPMRDWGLHNRNGSWERGQESNGENSKSIVFWEMHNRGLRFLVMTVGFWAGFKSQSL